MHYLEQHSDKEDHPLRLVRESPRKSFRLQGLIAKNGTFSDVRSISYTDSDLQRIVDHQNSLVDPDGFKPYNKPKQVREDQRQLHQRKTSQGINNLGLGIKATVFCKQSSVRDETMDNNGKSIDLEEIGMSPVLSKRNTAIHFSPPKISHKRVKLAEKRNSHPVSVFRNINL
jgi:hypothetical protein